MTINKESRDSIKRTVSSGLHQEFAFTYLKHYREFIF